MLSRPRQELGNKKFGRRGVGNQSQSPSFSKPESTTTNSTMASRTAPKTTFEVNNVIQPIYTGGSIGLDSGARILASTLGEDVVLTELSTGRRLAEIEGDGEPISTLTG